MRIGIDLDEVVADSIAAIIKLHNERYGTRLKRDDFHTYVFEEVWGGTREEAIKKVDEFFATDQLKNISPIAGSLKAIAALKAKGHELYVITGRSNDNVRQTEQWLEGHFPDVFLGVHYTSIFSLTEKPRKKSETCKKLGVEVLIDDHMRNVLDCAGEGIRVLLFDQPWNRGHELPGNVERVFSWDEIMGKF